MLMIIYNKEKVLIKKDKIQISNKILWRDFQMEMILFYF